MTLQIFESNFLETIKNFISIPLSTSTNSNSKEWNECENLIDDLEIQQFFKRILSYKIYYPRSFKFPFQKRNIEARPMDRYTSNKTSFRERNHGEEISSSLVHGAFCAPRKWIKLEARAGSADRRKKRGVDEKLYPGEKRPTSAIYRLLGKSSRYYFTFGI